MLNRLIAPTLRLVRGVAHRHCGRECRQYDLLPQVRQRVLMHPATHHAGETVRQSSIPWDRFALVRDAGGKTNKRFCLPARIAYLRDFWSRVMKCPTCPSAELVISERSGIEIDYCPQCRGVWLDRGELDKIVDRAADHSSGSSFGSSSPSRNDRHSRDADDDRSHHREPRRKSWFSELFD